MAMAHPMPRFTTGSVAGFAPEAGVALPGAAVNPSMEA